MAENNNVEVKTTEPRVILTCVMSQPQFAEITKMISSLNRECRMIINGEGISTAFTDTANVAMLNMVYWKKSFEKYEYTNPETTPSAEIGIDITIWKKYAKNVKKGMVVTWIVTQTQKEQTPEEITKGKCPEYSYTYTLSCGGSSQKITALDVNTLRKMPNVSAITSFALDNTLSVCASEFIDAIKCAGDVSDKVTFDISKTEFQILSESAESNFCKVVPVISKTGPGAKAIFSNDYLKYFVKSIQYKKETLEVKLKTDCMIRVGMVDKNREIVFCLAPRIKDY